MSTEVFFNVSLYLGGTRSGKSVRAEEEAKRISGPGGRVLYVATAQCFVGDTSMAERITRHQTRRPEAWDTLECPLNVAAGIEAAWQKKADSSATRASGVANCYDVVLIDCVTLWVTNILLSLPEQHSLQDFEARIDAEAAALCTLMRRTQKFVTEGNRPCHWILVSGETGLGGIQENAMSREFCDGLGRINQRLAAHAQKSYFCIAGKVLPLQDLV